MKRLCCFRHMGVDFERAWENVQKNGNAVSSLVTRCLSKDLGCEKLNCLYAGGQSDPFFDVHNPAHSDFLIHWTGRDIDNKFDPNWEQSNDITLNQKIVEPYIDRLKNILQHGIWMTSTETDQALVYDNMEADKNVFYRTCFSELKLSETCVHAKRFGRLGIGFKRPFVLHKRGLPVTYFHDRFQNWFLESFEKDQENRKIKLPSDVVWPHYLKSMNEGKIGGGYMQYKNFDESEWRVIYSDQIMKKFGSVEGIKNYSDIVDSEFEAYLKKYNIPEAQKPKYLIPLDYWFAVIIYPSLAVKVYAEQDAGVRSLIKKKKPTLLPGGKQPTTSAGFEPYSNPFEIDLDACRNF